MIFMTWIISLTISSPIALGMNYTERLPAALYFFSHNDDDEEEDDNDAVYLLGRRVTHV